MKKHLLGTIFLISILKSATGIAQSENPIDFLPNGYILVDKIYGDLNKDEIADCVLLIKATDQENVVQNRFNVTVDRNRRGVIVLLHTKNGYEMVVNNPTCFSSENEDGGVYYQPQLSIRLNEGRLYINYEHGRYGLWKYTFRFQNEALELIGYDASNNYGPVTLQETSFNFLTMRKLLRKNTNPDAEGNDGIFKETWDEIRLAKRIKLSEIKDFDDIDKSNW